MKLETNVKVLNTVVAVIVVVLVIVGYKVYNKYQQIDGIIEKVKVLEKFTPVVKPRFPNIFKDSPTVKETTTMVAPEPEVIVEKEYILYDPTEAAKEDEYADWIDPSTVPTNGPLWKYGDDGIEETVESLTAHLAQEKHGVKPSQVFNWTLPELIKLHSYLHNGGKLEDLKKKPGNVPVGWTVEKK